MSSDLALGAQDVWVPGAQSCKRLPSAHGAETPGLLIPTPAAPVGTASVRVACGPPAPLPSRIGVHPAAGWCLGVP